MESKERFAIEVMLGVIFLAILILGSIIVINASKGSETEVTITDSFNTYNYNYDTSPIRESPVAYSTINSKPYIVDDYRYYRDDYNYERYYYLNDELSDINYDSWSRLRVGEGLFGNDINNYEVYVFNREYTGEYFEVTFHFEDYNGEVDSRTISHYIEPREESKFVIKDVTPNRYENKRWWYEVKPVN